MLWHLSPLAATWCLPDSAFFPPLCLLGFPALIFLHCHSPKQFLFKLMVKQNIHSIQRAIPYQNPIFVMVQYLKGTCRIWFCLDPCIYYWNTINKNSDIGVQPEGQKGKISQSLALTSTLVQNGNPASRNLRMRLGLRTVSSRFTILSSSEIKGVHYWH